MTRQPTDVTAAHRLASQAKRVFVPLVVQVELLWVLESGYRLDKDTVTGVLQWLEVNHAFALEDDALCRNALTLYRPPVPTTPIASSSRVVAPADCRCTRSTSGSGDSTERRWPTIQKQSGDELVSSAESQRKSGHRPAPSALGLASLNPARKPDPFRAEQAAQRSRRIEARRRS